MKKLIIIITALLTGLNGLIAQVHNCLGNGTAELISIEKKDIGNGCLLKSIELEIDTENTGKWRWELGEKSGKVKINANGFNSVELGPINIKKDCSDLDGLFLTLTPPGSDNACDPIPLVIALPVELSDFSSEVLEDKVRLHWTTASETNNKGFDILHSHGNTEWKSIGFIWGQNNSSEQQHYSFTTNTLPGGTHYFQLNQLDWNGNNERSKVIAAAIERGKQDGFTIQPNIVSANGNVQITNLHPAPTTANIYSLSGQLVKTLQLNDSVTNWQADLPKGTYVVSVELLHGMDSKRLVVM